MAAVDVVMPPPPPPPAPAVRINRLALAAADAFVCLSVATLWVIHACLAVLATAVIRILVICGLDCTGSAWKVVLVSLFFVSVLWPLAALQPLLLIKFVELYTKQKGAAISEAVVTAHLTATMVFTLLELFGFLLNLWAPKDSLAERIASVIMVVPTLGVSVMCCLVSIPGLAVKVWRMRRCANFASVVPIND